MHPCFRNPFRAPIVYAKSGLEMNRNVLSGSRMHCPYQEPFTCHFVSVYGNDHVVSFSVCMLNSITAVVLSTSAVVQSSDHADQQFAVIQCAMCSLGAMANEMIPSGLLDKNNMAH